MQLLNSIIRASLLALLCIAPWLIAGGGARARGALLLVVAVLLALEIAIRCSYIHWRDRSSAIVMPTAWIPVILGIGLGLYQLIPWPTPIANLIAPGSVAWRAELLDVGSTTNAGGPSDLTLTTTAQPRTLYPLATRERLALLVLGLGLLAIVSLQQVNERTVPSFFIVIAISGAALTLFGLLQTITQSDNGFALIERFADRAESIGTFDSRMSSGSFLNLCLAAAIGLIVWFELTRRRATERTDLPDATTCANKVDMTSRVPRKRQRRPTDEELPPVSSEEHLLRAYRRSRLSHSSRRFSHRAWRSFEMTSALLGRCVNRAAVGHLFEQLTTSLAGSMLGRIALATLAASLVAGVALTTSRVAILAMLSATITTAIILMLTRQESMRSTRWLWGAFAILLAGLTSLYPISRAVLAPNQTSIVPETALYELDSSPLRGGVSQIIPSFLFAGSGLGTYSMVEPRNGFNHLNNAFDLQSQSQLVRTLVELGLIGFTLLLAAITLTGLSIVQLFRAGGRVNVPIAAAATFGLTSQWVGGLFDVGLDSPANMLLMATLCGLAIGRAARLPTDPDDALAPRVAPTFGLGVRLPSFVAIAGIGLLSTGCVVGAWEMHRAARLESALVDAQLAPILQVDGAGIHTDNVSQAITAFTDALHARPDNAAAQENLGRLLIRQYQSESYLQLLAEQANKDTSSTSTSTKTVAMNAIAAAPIDTQLWRRASIAHLHETLHELSQAGKSEGVEQLRNNDRVQRLLQPAVLHLLAARQSAPLNSRVHYHLAELTAVMPELGDQDAHLRRAQWLSPNDATLWYLSGQLQLNARNTARACADWRRSVSLSAAHLDDVMESVKGKLTLRELLEDTLPEDADVLVYVARKFFSTPQLMPHREVILAYAARAAETSKLPPVDRGYAQAAVTLLRGRDDTQAPNGGLHSRLQTTSDRNN